MKGIRFGDLHTYDNFGLILSSQEIGSPQTKVRKIDVEGADSALDVTDYFGGAKYEDVTHRFDFTAVGTRAQLLTLYAQVKAAVHGKRMRIVFDDDPEYYYMGRCFVSSLAPERCFAHIEIECECDPYKLKVLLTSVTQDISGSGSVTLTNGRKRAVPTITASAAFTLGYNGKSFSREAGTYTIPEIELVEGQNVVTVTGTGTISFTWREGAL